MVLRAPKKEEKIVRDEAASAYKIRVVGLHKTYLLGTNAVPALRGVDLDIRAGEFVALMGPSGCGKTTLLNLIGGLDYPSRGHIYLDGVDMSTLSENQLADLRRDKIGYVFQFYNLLPLLTAVENVMIPLHFQGRLSKRARKRKAMELLKLVKLDERAEHTPSELSGGEQQRVAIARAFANDPS
jgi:putative ABC transport system ATP-binding protein